jgi:hypothetical protein
MVAAINIKNEFGVYAWSQEVKTQRQAQPGSSPVLHSPAMEIFQKMASDLDTEGRYLFLNALANQLRYPNNHTHYFSCVLLYLFSEAKQVGFQDTTTTYRQAFNSFHSDLATCISSANSVLILRSTKDKHLSREIPFWKIVGRKVSQCIVLTVESSCRK